MTQFELIDDYLANRLNEQDKNAFDQQLEGDPTLREEVDFQRQVVQGVHQARTAELKTMLNNVPITGSGWSAGQITATAVSVALVATALYFYLKDDQTPIAQPDKKQHQEVAPPSDNMAKQPAATTDTKEKAEPAVREEQPANAPRITKKNVITSPVQKPAIQVVDPSDELKETGEASATPIQGRSEIIPSKLEVITESSDKKHGFHYQFSQGKLMLFGPFDKNLYEILEIHGEDHAVFLFYKENYYLLDEKEIQITQLTYIRDSQLLKKLKEYRGR